jgi:hypothetical protein
MMMIIIIITQDGITIGNLHIRFLSPVNTNFIDILVIIINLLPLYRVSYFVL